MLTPANTCVAAAILGCAAAKTLVKVARQKPEAGKPRRNSSSHWEDISMELTRRHALAGAAAIAATPLLAVDVGAGGRAGGGQAGAELLSLQGRRHPGHRGFRRPNTFPLADSFITNAKKDEVNAALEKAFLPSDMVTIYFAPLVINTGGKLVVIDTGNGPAANASSKGANGLFAQQHGRRGLRSQGGRHGGDLAFPRRPRERAADRRRHAGVSRTPKCWCRRPSGNSGWTTAR